MPEKDLALTFAGGGNRAFYQLGLLRRLGDELFARARVVVACSAGACVVTFHLAERTAEAHEFWLERRANVTKNLDWGNLFRRGARVAPHGPIYRATLLHAFAEGGLERIRALPYPVLVVAARFPRFLPPPVAVGVGLGAYSGEKLVRKRMLHPRLGRAIGFRPFVFDARDCETPEELADLIVASSSTPPFTPVGMFRGERLLDGGMVDNAPAFVGDEYPGVRSNVVFLTRHYAAGDVGARGARLYVAPRGPVPVHRWDYTRPELIDATIRLGEADAGAHAPALERFLARE